MNYDLDTIFSPQGGEAKAGPVTAGWIEARLKALIGAGALPAGCKLPAIRDAAWRIGCAPGTVARAYAGLRAAGLVESRVGSGTTVMGRSEARATYAGMLDLTQNVFQFEPLGEAVETVFAAASKEIAAERPSFDPAGHPVRRERAFSFLTAPFGFTAAANLVLTNGTHSSISAAIAGLTAPGATIACDALTYPGVIAVARLLGRRLVGVPHDSEGLDPAALDQLARQAPPAALFVMPDVHNPTGAHLSSARREQIVDICRRHEILIFEDAVYDGLHEREAITLLELAPERTIRMKSLSKAVSMSLRAGFVLGPDHLAARLSAAHTGLQLLPSPIMTEIAVRLLEENLLQARTKRLRDGLASRQDRALATLPDLDEAKLAAGMAWLPLSESWTAESFAAAALDAGVKVLPARAFSTTGGPGSNAVRLCLGGLDRDDAFQDALDRLASLLAAPPAPMVAP